jgi:hypothetical protein
MVVDMNNPLDGGETERHGYGFVGVLLPVGWTIDNNQFTFDYFGTDDKYYEERDTTGFLLFNQEMTDYCLKYDSEDWGNEYYWQGFRTEARLHSEHVDSIVIRFNVTVDDQTGDYSMLVGIQETSYDKKDADNNPLNEGDPGNSLEDNKGAGPFYKTGDPASDEFSKEYLSITVEETNSATLQQSKDDKGNYLVTALGGGKLLVDLLTDSHLNARCIVYDANGRTVASQTLTQTSNILEAALSTGIHFVSVRQGGISSSKKVLVR